MRQLSCSVCLAVLLAIIVVRAQPTATCETKIVVQKNASGMLEILNPDAMKCAPGEPMNVHVENHDSGGAYRVQISDIGCKFGGGRGKNPTKGFVNAPVDVGPGGTKDLISGNPPQKPTIRSRAEVLNLNCASGSQNDFRYKYVIRATGRGNNASARLDPDLEIST